MSRCPFADFAWGRSCKADGKDRPKEIADNLCDSSNHEDCPVFKAATGKS